MLKKISNILVMLHVKRVKKVTTEIDIHTDKSGSLRFHIHGLDGRIVATSNPYDDLAELKKDLDELLNGTVKIKESSGR